MTNKPLTRTTNPLFHYADGVWASGANPRMRGDCSELRGDCTYLSGDCSRLWGDCTDLRGDCTGLSGDCSEIPTKARPCGIADWVKP